MDNYRLSQYYKLQQSNDDSEVTEVLNELTEIEHRIEHGEMITDSEFIRPGGLSNNWDENNWMRRLHTTSYRYQDVQRGCNLRSRNAE
jgi:hypothetical protein